MFAVKLLTVKERKIRILGADKLFRAGNNLGAASARRD